MNQFGEKTDYDVIDYFSIDTTLNVTSDSAYILSWDSINNVVYISYETYLLDTTYLDSNQLTNQFKNRHSYLTIPLLLGYEFQRNKWNLNLKLGLGVSFLIKNKSQYLNYELTNLTSLTPKRIVLNYLIAPTIGYQISNKFNLEIAPQIIINSGSLINYEDIKQQYTNFGISFGINYSLHQ